MTAEAVVAPIHQLSRVGFQPLFDMLDQGAIIAGHGPTGTELRGYDVRHTAIGGHNIALTDEGADQLRQVHKRYGDAGAVLIESYTWGPSPRVFQEHGLPDELGATLDVVEHDAARQAADAVHERTGVQRFVVDTARPVEDCYKPTPDDVTDEELFQLHLEQARHFYEAGSQGVLLQTFPSVREIRAAVRAFELYEIPIVGVSAYVVETDSDSVALPSGDSLADVAEIAERHGAMVGINCIAPEVGVRAVNQLIAQAGGALRLYVGLNGLSNDPHDPIHAAKSHEELATEANSEGNRALLLGAYRAIVEAIRNANNDPRRVATGQYVGAVLASCCFTTPQTTEVIAGITAEPR